MVFDWLEDKIPVAIFVKKRMNDDILVVCAENLVIYYFNSTAAFFLNSVDGKSTIGDIKAKFLQKYDVDEQELEADLTDVIRDLQWKKVLVLE